MSYTTEILADYSVSAEAPGNKLTLEAELVSTKSNELFGDNHQIGLGLTFNTAHDGEPDTEVYIQLPLDKASELSDAFRGMIARSEMEKTETILKVFEFRTAQLACAKGQIGQLRITKIADSGRGDTVGFGFYNLEYLDDQADAQIIHSVENIECYVPFAEADQYEWLRTLVGGNHAFSSLIKVQLIDFTFDQAREEFNAHIASKIQG